MSGKLILGLWFVANGIGMMFFDLWEGHAADEVAQGSLGMASAIFGGWLCAAKDKKAV